MVVVKRVVTVLRDRWNNLRTVLVSKPFEKHWAPRRKYSQSASIQSANLCLLVGVAWGPVRRGARSEEIGQIGLKPALRGVLKRAPLPLLHSVAQADFMPVEQRCKRTICRTFKQ